MAEPEIDPLLLEWQFAEPTDAVLLDYERQEWRLVDGALTEVAPVPPDCAHIHQPPTDRSGRYVEGDWTCQFCGHKTPMYAPSPSTPRGTTDGQRRARPAPV